MILAILSLLLGVAQARTITLDVNTVVKIQSHLAAQNVQGIVFSSAPNTGRATLSWSEQSTTYTLKGSLPSLGGCGSGAVLSAASADEKGAITIGSSPGSCVLSFSWPLEDCPIYRVYNHATGDIVKVTPSVSGFTILSTIAEGDVLDYER